MNDKKTQESKGSNLVLKQVYWLWGGLLIGLSVLYLLANYLFFSGRGDVVLRYMPLFNWHKLLLFSQREQRNQPAFIFEKLYAFDPDFQIKQLPQPQESTYKVYQHLYMIDPWQRIYRPFFPILQANNQFDLLDLELNETQRLIGELALQKHILDYPQTSHISQAMVRLANYYLTQNQGQIAADYYNRALMIDEWALYYSPQPDVSRVSDGELKLFLIGLSEHEASSFGFVREAYTNALIKVLTENIHTSESIQENQLLLRMFLRLEDRHWAINQVYILVAKVLDEDKQISQHTRRTVATMMYDLFQPQTNGLDDWYTQQLQNIIETNDEQ